MDQYGYSMLGIPITDGCMPHPLIVSFGHGLMEPIWDLSHVMPRAFLLSALLLLPIGWDTWSLDEWIKNKMKLDKRILLVVE